MEKLTIQVIVNDKVGTVYTLPVAMLPRIGETICIYDDDSVEETSIRTELKVVEVVHTFTFKDDVLVEKSFLDTLILVYTTLVSKEVD